MDVAEAPVLPEYGGACLDGVVPAILGRHRDVPSWFPEALAGADQVVLLVLDGLGWVQLRDRAALAPNLSSMTGGPITTVAPSTTATALTSLTTGAPPSAHGVVGYRVRVEDDQVLNVLRWKTGDVDARERVPPRRFQPLEPFSGAKPAVVTKGEFHDSGFTGAHLAGARMHGWRMPSTLAHTVAQLLASSEPFVYGYYPGVDTVAHQLGLGGAYDAELVAADRLVGDVLAALPSGAALVVVSDHGQVDVGDSVVAVHADVMECARLLSGEGRFRWLHTRPGMHRRLAEEAEQHHGGEAWVRTRDEAEAEGWFGGRLHPEVASRLGDVVLAARRPIAFLDPADTGEVTMRSRHGSLTSGEMFVPLLAARA
jgi:hypothetical protein